MSEIRRMSQGLAGQSFYQIAFAFVLALSLSFVLIQPHVAHAASCTFASVGTSDFNTAGNWTCGHSPVNGDDVTIPTGTSTTMSASSTFSTLSASGSLNALTFNLTVSSTLTVFSGGTVTSTSAAMNFGGAASSTGSIGSNSGTMLFGSTLTNNGLFQVGSGTVTSTGNLVIGASGTMNGNSGTIKLGADWTDNGTFNGGVGTVAFVSGGAQNINAEPHFYNLTVMKAAGTVGMNADVSASNNVTIVSGTLNTNGSVLSIGGNWVDTGTLSGNGTQRFNGTGAQSIGVEPNFYDLVIAKSTGTATLVGQTTSTNSVTISSGTLALGANTLHDGGSWIDTGTLSAGSGTVDFNGLGAQTVGAEPNFNNVTARNFGGIINQNGNVAVGGTFIITATGTNWDASTRNLTVTGATTILSASSVTSSSGTLTFSGAATSTGSIGSNSGNINFGSTYQNNGTLNVGAGITTAATTTNAGTINGGSGTLVFQAGFTNSGTFNHQSGTVRYTPGVSVSIVSTVYNNLELSGSGTGTLAASTTVLGTLTNSGTFVVGANTLTAIGVITNTGLITESSGSIIHTHDVFAFTNSTGVTQTSFTTPDTVYVTLQDGNRNLDGTTIESINGTITAGTDSEAVTLTETTASSGIFRGHVGLAASTVVSVSNGQIELSASGSGSTSYTDNQDPADTATTTVTLTFSTTNNNNNNGGGGGGGGGGAATNGATSGLSNFVTSQQTSTNLQNLQNIGVAVHSLVKLPDDRNANTQSDSAVYYVGSDGMRHAFPNDKVYFTWYSSFNGVQVVSGAQLASIPLGKNVTYKPGVKMVKFTTDPKVYVVVKGGVLRPIASESVASSLYGANWNRMIDDISDAFYTNYTYGASVNSTSDYSPSGAMSSVVNPSDSLQ